MKLAERIQHVELSPTFRINAMARRMKAQGIEPQRLKMAALCSVCAEPFVNYMREFSTMLTDLGPVSAAKTLVGVAS